MKIVEILGGLGNQMFQYAFYNAIKTKSPNEDVYCDISGFNNYNLHDGYVLNSNFNISANLCTAKQINKLKYDDRRLSGKILKKIFKQKKTVLIEPEDNKFRFVKDYLTKKKDTYYSGYWQTYKYLEHTNNNLFEFNVNKLSNKNKELVSELNSVNSVSIHIRRGDYVNHPLFGGICDDNYYKQAIKKFINMGNCKFYIFSNDSEWCKNKYKDINPTIINWNSGKNSYLDMYLMTQCKHNIIANSSFSWWGAYLNKNSEKIAIAPKKWKNNMDGTRDLIPTNWHKI